MDQNSIINKFGIDIICTKPIDSIECLNPNQKQCCPLFSVSEIGDYCRNQYSRLSSSKRDNIMFNYCIKYPHTPECKCINRSYDPDFIKLKLGNPFPDSCWYIPCANRLQYFVNSSFNIHNKCPSNICKIVYDISKVNNVNIHNIENDINCNMHNGGSIPDPSKIPNYIYVIIIIVAAAFILVYSLKRY